MKRNIHIIRPCLALLVLACFCTACSPFKPSPRRDTDVGLPPQFIMYGGIGATDADTPLPDKWWTGFGNPELDRLVEDALRANFDLEAVWARLRQTRAAAVQSGAGKYPTLEATGGYSHKRQETDSLSGSGKSQSTDESTLGLGAGYELDLWGRIEAQATSGMLDVRASREELNAAAMTVAGEVVSKWVQVQAQRRKKRLLLAQIESNQTYLELIELRFRNSLATALDVYQQRENLAQVKAKLPPVESEEQLLLHELAVLLGRPAGSVRVADADLPHIQGLPRMGIPADLLAKRPDIRSAGLELRSADWSVAAARADRLPSVKLAANMDFSAPQLATLFENWMLTLAGSVTGHIFDGGYRKAEVDKARAVVDERLADYKSTVFTAFKEVEDALASEKWQRRYIEARRVQLEAARVNLKEASSRYMQGLDTYLPVLTALFSVQDLEFSMVQDRTDLLLSRVALYRALGGSWPENLTPPVSDDAGPTDSSLADSSPADFASGMPHAVQPSQTPQPTEEG